MKEKYHAPYNEKWMGTVEAEIFFDENDNPQLKSERSVIEVMRIVIKACDGKPSRLKVLDCWLNNYSAAHAHTRDGLIKNIANDTKMHRNTVAKHVKAIRKHKILGKVFKYKTNRGKK